jgi:lipoprotein-releasing system permease protein
MKMHKIIFFYLKKYIFSSQKEWLRFDSIFMMGGIILSVAILTIATSVFEGYENSLKEAILGANSHIYVFRNGTNELNPKDIEELQTFLSAKKEVETFSTVVLSQAMASHQNRIKGTMLRGINWKQEKQASAYQKFVRQGTHQLQTENDIVLGTKLAFALNAALGDTIQLISPIETKVSAFGVQNKIEDFRIVGLYRSGMHEYDSKFAFINQSKAMEFAGLENEFSLLEIKVLPSYIESADFLAFTWAMDLDYRYQISSWIDFNENLFSLLTLQKWVLFIILSFLILIASFNVLSAVSTAILEKKKDIGILFSIGASNTLIKQIFLGKVLFLSVLAILLGLISGFLISWLISLQTVFMLKGDVYFIEKLTMHFNLSTAILIFAVALLIVSLSSFIPLKKISKMEIQQILN